MSPTTNSRYNIPYSQPDNQSGVDSIHLKEVISATEVAEYYAGLNQQTAYTPVARVVPQVDIAKEVHDLRDLFHPPRPSAQEVAKMMEDIAQYLELEATWIESFREQALREQR